MNPPEIGLGWSIALLGLVLLAMAAGYGMAWSDARIKALRLEMQRADEPPCPCTCCIVGGCPDGTTYYDESGRLHHKHAHGTRMGDTS